jgi:hypothetical protein
MEKQVCPDCGRCIYLGVGGNCETTYSCSVHGSVTPKTVSFLRLDFPPCPQCGGPLEARPEGDPIKQKIFCTKDGEVILDAARPTPSPGLTRFERRFQNEMAG